MTYPIHSERAWSVILLVIVWVVGVAHPGKADELPNPSNAVVRDAAARAIQLVERTSAEFLRTRECFTCHTQTLGAMVLSDARTLGYQVYPQNLSRQVERVSEVDSSLENGQLRVDTVGHALWTMDIGQRVPDRVTENMVAYLLSYQKELGHWEVTVDRPPAEASDFTTNYVAIRGLKRYGTNEQKPAIAARTAAVREWMKTARTSSTEDEVFRLRLATELKTDPKRKDSYAQELLAKQHPSGGWSQEVDMKPDAYATGSVLVALHAAAGIPPDHSSWRRGLAYLLATQESDGSWHVVTRAKPIQEYFESGFPHGKDQFISAFATGWATQALLISVRHGIADEQSQRPQRGDSVEPEGRLPAPDRPTAEQLQPLQGIWEGVEAGRETEGKCTITITGHSIHFQGSDPNEWYKATFTLPAGKEPKQLHAKITDCPQPEYLGKIGNAIYQIRDGTLTITGNEPGNPAVPTGFDAPGGRKLVVKRK